MKPPSGDSQGKGNKPDGAKPATPNFERAETPAAPRNPAQEGGERGPDGGAAERFLVRAPTLSLPKGGGALRGMGEKFQANPVTGTAGASVPIAVSPGRGLAPELALAYDSGAGNGPFGLGVA